MNRRNFFKSIGLLVGSTLIPSEVLPITDFVEKKSFPVFDKNAINNQLILIKARRHGLSNAISAEMERYMIEQERKYWFKEK